MYAEVAQMNTYDANECEKADIALVTDAKLNAAKAIVAEKMDNAIAMIVDCAKTKHWTILMPKLVDDAEAALTAWRELTTS
jgi:uncharacterized membrane protein